MGTVTTMAEQNPIRVGSRVYLRNCVAGEPGCVVGFSRGKAEVYWPDLDLGRNTFHAIETLEVDTGFVIRQLGLDFEEAAA
jgi:hypothetical protein